MIAIYFGGARLCMKKIRFAVTAICLTVILAGCGNSVSTEEMQNETDGELSSTVEPVGFSEQDGSAENETAGEREQEEMRMEMKIDGELVAVEWEDNESVAAIKALLRQEPVSMQMSMYGGFEQVGSFGTELPRADEQTTTQAGDIVLYSGSQMVVFYGSNSWAYTRLGRITDKSTEEMEELLGGGDVTITLTLRS